MALRRGAAPGGGPDTPEGALPGRAWPQASMAGRLDLDARGERCRTTAATARPDVAHTGVGRWTADIYLLMGLGRPDVWPSTDLALIVRPGSSDSGRTRRRPTSRPSRRLASVRSVAARMLWQAISSSGAGRSTIASRPRSGRTGRRTAAGHRDGGACRRDAGSPLVPDRPAPGPDELGLASGTTGRPNAVPAVTTTAGRSGAPTAAPDAVDEPPRAEPDRASATLRVPCSMHSATACAMSSAS